MLTSVVNSLEMEVKRIDAEIFLAKFTNNRDDLCWDDLCEGLNDLFYAGMNDDIPRIMEYMDTYRKEMSI